MPRAQTALEYLLLISLLLAGLILAVIITRSQVLGSANQQVTTSSSQLFDLIGRFGSQAGCTLAANPTTLSSAGGPSNLTIAYQQLSPANGNITVTCGTGTSVNATGCADASSGTASCTVNCTYSASGQSNLQTYTVSASIGSVGCVGTSVSVNGLCTGVTCAAPSACYNTTHQNVSPGCSLGACQYATQVCAGGSCTGANICFVVDTTPPQSNSPSDATYSQGGSGNTIGWALTDNAGTGQYRVLRNGTQTVGWTNWNNNTNLAVPVDTTTSGYWNYTLFFNDSSNNFGTPDSVFITVAPDTTPPTLIILSPSSGQSFYTPVIPYNISATDASGVVSCNSSTDGQANVTMMQQGSHWNRTQVGLGSQAACGGGCPPSETCNVGTGVCTSGLSYGTHSVTFYCTDGAGNLGTASVNFVHQFNGTWVQTNQTHFSAGTLTNVELISSGDSVQLSRAPTNWALLGTGGPSARRDFAMAYDSVYDSVVLFGGYNGSTTYGDTWEYDINAGTWAQISPVGGVAPSARTGSAMVYDASQNTMVLSSGGSVQDTWEYNVNTNTWTQTSASGPIGRHSHAMTYDSDRARTVLFGGANPGVNYSDMWEYNAATNGWTQITPVTIPPGRFDHRMVHQPGKSCTGGGSCIVLFGGVQIGGTWLDDTWEYSSTANTWTNTTGGARPYRRTDHGMSFDTSRATVVLYGGFYALAPGPYFNDTWEYDSDINLWTEITPATVPAGRWSMGFTYINDAPIFGTFMFGGSSSVYYQEYWRYRSPYSPSGTLASQIFDATSPASWTNVSWIQSLVGSTNIQIQTRSCTTATCGGESYSTPVSCGLSTPSICTANITSPDGRRYFQWLANLSTADEINSPVLLEVNTTYTLP